MAASWESWQTAKRTAIEFLAVFIASAGFIIMTIFSIAILAALFSLQSDVDKIEEQWVQSYKTLERENRLLQLEVDGFKVALDKAGITTGHEKP